MATLRVTPGRVIYAIPGLNSYVVQPYSNIAAGPLRLACAAYGSTQYQDGVACPESYTPGTSVLLGIPDRPRSDGSANFPENIVLILGPYSLMPGNKNKEQHPNISMDPSAQVDIFNSSLTTRALEAMRQPYMARDYSYGQSPLDMLPGDFVRHSPFGCGLLVSLTQASLYGGPLARMDFSPLDQKALLFAQTLALQSLFRDDGHYPDKDDTHFYERRAYSLNEGMGVYSGSAFQEKSKAASEGSLKTYSPKEDDQIGIFRRETHEGLIADGLWTFTEIPEIVEVRTRSKSDVPPLGLHSRRVFMNGLEELRSAMGFSMIKAPWVPVLRELLSEQTGEKLEDDAEVSEAYKTKASLTDEEYDEFAATVMTDEFKYNMEKVYGKRPRGRKKNWKIYSDTEVYKAYGLDAERPEKLELIEPTANAYAAEKTVAVADPATTEITRVSSTVSGIRQLPDGTIVISDGWGSEIRMSRGNVTITCPNDIRILPGRDSVEMVPRNKVINAGVDLYAEAANGSMYVKAENSLKMLAGNSGHGALVLESRGVQDGTQAAAALKATEMNGGVVIKTNDGLAMLARRVHVGSPDNGEGKTDGLERSKPCDIMIDAGTGVLNLAGATGYMKFDTSMAAMVGGASQVKTALGMGAGELSLFGELIGLCGTTIKAAPLKPTVFDVKTMKAGGIGGVPFNGASSVNVQIMGNAQMTGGMDVAGLFRSGKCWSDEGHFKNASTCSQLRVPQYGPGTVTLEELKPAVLTGPANNYASGFPTSANAAGKIHTGAYAYYTGFYWRKDSEDYWAADTRIYAARWQVMLKSSGHWHEPAVESPGGTETYAWPGKKAWTTSKPYGEFLGKGVNSGNMEQYKTSVKTQKEYES